MRSFIIDGHRLGLKELAIIRNIRGAKNTALNGDAFGTTVSGRYRQGGRTLEVAVKRGSTVLLFAGYIM